MSSSIAAVGPVNVCRRPRSSTRPKKRCARFKTWMAPSWISRDIPREHFPDCLRPISILRACMCVADSRALGVAMTSMPSDQIKSRDPVEAIAQHPLVLVLLFPSPVSLSRLTPLPPHYDFPLRAIQTPRTERHAPVVRRAGRAGACVQSPRAGAPDGEVLEGRDAQVRFP